MKVHGFKIQREPHKNMPAEKTNRKKKRNGSRKRPETKDDEDVRRQLNLRF